LEHRVRDEAMAYTMALRHDYAVLLSAFSTPAGANGWVATAIPLSFAAIFALIVASPA